MDNFEVIFWDFDGVIMDSMPIRNQGFYHIFKDFDSSAVELLMKFHKRNGGLSRYVKIRYFFEDVLNQTVSDQMIKDYADEFSKHMLENLIDEKLLIQDSMDFIKRNYSNKNFHIVSGSDEMELRTICSELKINKYFKTINGSPTPKVELVNSVLKKNGYDKNNCILIGDSVNDYEAAIKNGITFYGYNNLTLKEYGNYLECIGKLNF